MRSRIFDRFAARYRASLTAFLAPAGTPLMGACRSLFLERNRNLYWRKTCSCLTEAIHFGNDVHPGVALLRGMVAFRRNQWMLSIGITGGIRRNTQLKKIFTVIAAAGNIPRTVYLSERGSFSELVF